MLDAATKRRIDTARDILVGKVPDPKSQVEQITIALIYKFMDDMDAESEELGGERKFFAGEFARFGWPRLVRSGLGGHEILNLYAEAITRMPENPGVPSLFREIFKNAYLPYRDPETLRAFLKVIDEFEYDHSERLGDAFEYLLSVLGSQGDAGQFRTPRHIIDFMVALVDPKKDETVLDPACGTAGFLISSYKHICSANTDKEGNSTLTPDEKGKLAANFKGYDISPDMVRLSLVNMYLHGFVDPRIFEYDTLTSEDRWNEFADVVLANPPFMSPKGGIRPHNRFSVQSKRSEVLFVDYMAEHLTPSGRAAIIVPEGIIFQSQKAHKSLRKMLVEHYLVAVISLPAGVFQPYSGVKTSILLLDKALAKRTDSIAFFKVQNDGYGLGAQRRPIDKNDLPRVQKEIGVYLDRLRTGQSMPTVHVAESKTEYRTNASAAMPGLIAGKEKIAAGGEYNLNGERYRGDRVRMKTKWPIIELGETVEILDSMRRPITKHDRRPGPYPYYGATGVVDYVDGYLFDEPLVLVGEDGAKWGPGEQSAYAVEGKFWVNNHAHVLRPKRERLSDRFLIEIINFMDLRLYITGVTVPKLNQAKLKNIQIPLPPLEIQQEIVAEIEGYQRVIDGARAVIDNYRPQIVIDPEWPMVEIGDSRFFHIESGGTPKSNVEEYWNGEIPWITLVDLPATDCITEIKSTRRTISEIGLKKSAAKLIPQNSVIASTRATIGRIGINQIPLATNQGFKNIIVKDPDRAVPKYIALALTKLVPIMENQATGGTFKEISKSRFSELQIPLPSLETQQAIVTEIEAEQALVAANRELVERMEGKIKTAIGRVWGDYKADLTEGK